MEEDSVVKAPVTRLRRRLSVELSEDAKSPATPSTPTKKRGARLAAKPQLELIDEDTPQNTKRTTKKAKEPAEPVEEKVATPARRSTRVKSNTSLVLESVQAVDSPRAKRAARRNSQVGSDNEIPGTPVKAARTPARRTRNNSTSSVDKASAPGTPVKTPGRTTRRTASSADKQGDNESFSQNSQEIQNNVKSIITEVIAEEPEQELRKSRSNEATNNEKSPDSSPSSVRKSPRLMEKKHRKSESDSKDETSTIEENTPDENNGLNDEKDKTKHDQKTETGASKLSTSSVDLIRELDVKPKRKSSAANQSLSAIDDNSKTRKQRTKSWTTISSPTVNDNFYSDNESSKKKIKNTKGASNFLAINTGSGDGTDSGRNNESENSKTPTTRKKVSSESSFSVENIHSSLILPSPRQSEKHDKSLNETAKPVDISNNSNKENLFSSNKLNAELLFQKSPGKDLQAQVFIEDSDSNTEPTEKPNDIQTTDVEDQCVPQVIHEDNLGEKDTNVEATDKNKSTNIFNLESSPNNDTCEPMDVDVTIPENIQLNNSIEKSFLNKSKRKMSLNDSINSKIKNKSEEIPIKNHESSHYIPQESTINENNDKSKRKSSLNDSINKKAEEDQNKGTRTSLIDSLQETNDLNESKKSKRKLSLTDSINKRDTSNVTTDERLTKNSTLSTSQIVMDVSINKSKRKSSVSNSMSQDLEKSGNQNKSTLVLSQLKDDSSIENNTSKHLSENNAEFLKTSATNTPKEVVVNKNLSINYSTSTPVQQKNVNLAMQMNTSIISPSIESDKMGSGKQNKSKDKESTVESSESDSTNESDEEDSKEKTYLDDQADEASDDYESGDSQDESERLYEKEHEIIDKGTTLTSEEEMSDDTDYEKDSFVVSSDEEDNDLLSGSGDDLDMSDNELTMNPKSKKKYDERSRKLQKKASKEMFEARHKLDKPDKTSKNKLSDSTQESETEIMAPPKKNKRMRLDSNWDSSTVDENDSKELDNNVPVLENEANKKKKKSKQLSESQSENENRDSTMNESNTSNISRKKNKKAKLLLESTSESIVEGENTEPKAVSVTNNSMERTSGNKKKKAKRLSESMSNEKEITICNDTVTDQEDPLLKAIKQEVKTPQKDLDISTINFTVREELEQVHVNENISLLKANDTVDPLHDTLVDGRSDDSSISENEELMKDYDNVLNNLNKIGTKKIKTHDTSLNLDKKEKKARDSIIDKLNITQTNTKNKNKSKATVVKKANMVQDDNTNDSIDIKLLFSEDSNDSEAIKKQKPETQDNSYIPLKRTEAKTNISLKEADNIFFVDTEGTLADNSVNKLLNNISISGNEDTAPSKKENESPESDDAPIEISFKKDKAQDKNEQNKSTNEVAVLETSVGKKKKKKLSESMNVGKTDAAPIPTKNISLDSKKQGKTVTSLLTVTEIVNKDRNIPGSHDNEKRNLKRKRRLSTEDVEGDANTSKKSNNSFMQADLHKKRKLSNQNEETSQKSKDKVNEDQEVAQMNDQENSLMGKQKNKSLTNESVATSQVTAPTTETDSKKKRKKRKRDDTENDKVSKMMKENSLDNVHVPRLPSTIINQLEDKPRQDILKARKSTIISTTDFHVEEAKKRRNKPSNYLEESVYLNLEPEGPVKKKKYDNRKPKVLPFTPTASTSDSGFTTKFQVNVIPQKVEFTAQSTHVTDFKSNYLQERRKKKLNTFDLYKHQRHLKLSKF